MASHHTIAASSVSLRRRAVQRQGGAAKQRPPQLTPRGAQSERRLLHELEIHQFELEMQNEELRASRLEAEEEAARFAELYDFAPMGYATLDAYGSIRSVNFACASLLGVGRAALRRRRFDRFISPADRAAFLEFLAATLERRDKRICELRLAEAEGRAPVHARFTARSLAGEEILLAVEDVSDRQRFERRLCDANAQLAEADRRKNEFLGVLSHELRNPLTAISVGVDVLDHVPAVSPQAERARGIIRRQTEHLTRLVNDLLDVTRVSHGKVELQRRCVDLVEIALHCCEDHRELLEQRRIELRHDLPPDPVWIEADPLRIAQVLGNLLQNAMQFTPAGGAVTVRGEVRDGGVEVCVRDTGVGMRPADLERLFEPFAQAHRKLGRGQGGLGLGLAVSKGLVELHGGSIQARSDGPGRGSELRVRLPLAPAPAARAAAASAARGPAGKRVVLVIEDCPDTSELLEVALKVRGCEVRTARDGRTGIAMARELRPEVVLCDIGLPEVDGYGVARALRADEGLRGTRLIALSGYTGQEDEARARDAGFETHIAKPAKMEQVIELLVKPGRQPADFDPTGPSAVRA